MAYRRKPQPQPQPQPPPSFEHHHPPSVGPASPDSLAAQAMRASAAHRDASSIASAYTSSSSPSAAARRSHHEPSVSTPSPVSRAAPLLPRLFLCGSASRCVGVGSGGHSHEGGSWNSCPVVCSGERIISCLCVQPSNSSRIDRLLRDFPSSSLKTAASSVLGASSSWQTVCLVFRTDVCWFSFLCRILQHMNTRP
jgi:hypothetical protein